jgi:hypothetical protein
MMVAAAQQVANTSADNLDHSKNSEMKPVIGGSGKMVLCHFLELRRPTQGIEAQNVSKDAGEFE